MLGPVTVAVERGIGGAAGIQPHEAGATHEYAAVADCRASEADGGGVRWRCRWRRGRRRR